MRVKKKQAFWKRG